MATSGGPLRVCVDARQGAASGGVQQVVMGLAAGLASLTDGDEEYLFLCPRGGGGWLAPFLGGNSSLLGHRRSPLQTLRRVWTKGTNALAQLADDPAWKLPGVNRIRRSDGLAEAAGARLVHFTAQSAFLTRLPSIYQPWDLQHLHLPEFFTPAERARRERNYRLFCARAEVVAVATTWAKEDLVRQYGLAPEKVAVVPVAPPTVAYQEPSEADLAGLRTRLGFEGGFVYYPAQTWRHKNHLRLLEALARLRDQGLTVPLVCSGHLNDHFPAIKQRARELRLDGQVRFLGFVSTLEVRALYKLCTGVVLPTLFEAPGLPLSEAMEAGAAVACSAVTSLPRQAGDAALLFDPLDAGAIAEAIRRLFVDEALRRTLSTRARARIARFTWRDTALRFRALYRRLAGRARPADLSLLAEPPLL